MEFCAVCRFGRFDSAETCVEVELTQEEAVRLETQDREAESFAECEAVQDIYARAYRAAVAQITEELRESDAMGTAYLDEGQMADDVYHVEVLWTTE